MGTPEFAVSSLEALVQAGCNIVAVVTAQDKPAGRGMKLQQSAVKKSALNNNIPVLQPERLKNPQFLDELKALNADLQIVVAFRMLPEAVWNMPPMGTINLHASLLPQYRGAAPINWAIINGEKETGLTTFQLQHEIDTGKILLQEKLAIGDDETAGELHDRMKEAGASLLVETVKRLSDKSLVAVAQEELAAQQELRHAPKIFTDTCRINWDLPSEAVHNLIRGLSPYPAAFTQLDGKTLKIFKADKLQESPNLTPGQYLTDEKTFLRFACAKGAICIKELQLEGKKKMMIDEFLRGYRFNSK